MNGFSFFQFGGGGGGFLTPFIRWNDDEPQSNDDFNGDFKDGRKTKDEASKNNQYSGFLSSVDSTALTVDWNEGGYGQRDAANSVVSQGRGQLSAAGLLWTGVEDGQQQGRRDEGDDRGNERQQSGYRGKAAGEELVGRPLANDDEDVKQLAKGGQTDEDAKYGNRQKS